MGHTHRCPAHTGDSDGRTRSEGERRSKSGTHGSVLMEMIKSQDQQPKQVTVGTKGTMVVDVMSLICNASEHVKFTQ